MEVEAWMMNQRPWTSRMYGASIVWFVRAEDRGRSDTDHLRPAICWGFGGDGPVTLGVRGVLGFCCCDRLEDLQYARPRE